ncbi:MAG TPA: class I SAM-dependent methyltransferase [Rickettsiales bacterium]|nr:class I SAM-dependent methyltransferase [Rickettsiales bacterium]
MGTNPFLPDHVEYYVTSTITRETDMQRRLREETQTMPYHVMQVTPDEGAFLAMLVAMTGARRVLEIGTFTGYSALAMAMALPEDGLLVACDTNEEWTNIGRRYWREAGVEDKIDLRLGRAQETLDAMLEEGIADVFDLAFIDADKQGYNAYYETCLQLVRPGGIIAIDNALWGGAVAMSEDNEASTRALRALNLKIRNDARVDACLLTVADGIMLARKRG